jgi:putative phosphoribosyl transferase
MQAKAVRIPLRAVVLEGELSIPAGSQGLVLFAHGSGSSRHSPRNQLVAHVLRQAHLGTLLFDLLTRQEETTKRMMGHLRFDISLLADRLLGATAWLRQAPETRALKVGYFGASTGGGAALIAAAELGEQVRAVVSRGGRPDLAGAALPAVKAPTLLIVGGYDEPVIEMNRTAYAQLRCTKDLKIVPGATHLFDEPGTLYEVARLATQWFQRYLQSPTGQDQAEAAGTMSGLQRFRNRRDAGRQLATALSAYARQLNVLVLALPRGGVPVAFEVAQALNAPLDVFLVRKLGVPGHEELAMGAIASGGVRVLNEEVVGMLGIRKQTIELVTAAEQRTLEARERTYRGARSRPKVRGCTIILVDDGLATGTTMRAAVEALRAQEPRRIVVAVPVAPLDACNELRAEVDEIICTVVPEQFFALSLWYEDFSQTTDEEVRELLARVTYSIKNKPGCEE